jgi:hypothetical protein
LRISARSIAPPRAYASEIGLDVARFKADLDSRSLQECSEADTDYGNSLPGGGMGTPTFFINGRKIAGAYPYEKFERHDQRSSRRQEVTPAPPDSFFPKESCLPKNSFTLVIAVVVRITTACAPKADVK